MVSFLGTDNGSISDEREMDTWEWDEVSLELGEINIECSVKMKRRHSRGNNLSNQTIEIRVRGALYVKILMTDVKSGFIIDHKSAVGVFHSCMSSIRTAL